METHEELDAILELLSNTTKNTCLQRLRNCYVFPTPSFSHTFLWCLYLLSLMQGFPLESLPKSAEVFSLLLYFSFVNSKESHGCRTADLTYSGWQHLPALHHPTHWPNSSFIWPNRIKSIHILKNQPIHLLIYKTQHFSNCLLTFMPTILLKCSGVKKATGNSIVGQEWYLGI